MTTTYQKKVTVQSILLSTPFENGNSHTQNVFNQIKKCRTAALGYHFYKCKEASCTGEKYVYHSCRNRHCPNCGSSQQSQWIDDRRTELLPINYYHVVFTLPRELNAIILGNRTPLFKLLFDASSKTLLQFGADKKHLGAVPGIISVLHTWGQQLSFHPHIHCIVSGGGIVTDKIDKSIRWKHGVRNKDGFLFPISAMSAVYKAIFIKGVRALIQRGKVKVEDPKKTATMLQEVYEKEWVVYAKEPFAGPLQVIEYLGRYTHRVAISNHRIKSDNGDTVTIHYKDYADNNTSKTMTLSKQEFIRRFEQHILPKYFTKIRTTGYLSNRGRSERIKAICEFMNIPPPPSKVKTPWYTRLLEQFNIAYNQCPCCKQHTLKLLTVTYQDDS